MTTALESRCESAGTDSPLIIGLLALDSAGADVQAAAADAGIEIYRSASAADELAFLSPRLDVVLITAAADQTGLADAVRAARDAMPDTALIAIWRVADGVGEARRALRAGADGILSDEGLTRTLASTIDAVRNALVCVPGEIRAMLESESLSLREKQILSLMVRGSTNAEIAAKLFLAESTVKSHLSSAYTKLGVRSRTEAATMILDPVEGLGPGILAIAAA